jgi:hypothetical protein
MFHRRARPAPAAAAAILVPTFGALLALREPRFLFFLPLAIVLALGGWWTAVATSHRPKLVRLDKRLIAGMVLVLLIQSAVGLATFPQQVQWYSALSPDVVADLRRLDSMAARDAVLAVSPAANQSQQDGWPLGWWVEGLLDRPTYYASSFEWLNQADERRRASLANVMFSPSQGVSGAVRVARANHINYLVVATGWPGYRAWVSRGRSLEGASVVINTEAMIVISTDG